jgi:nitroreductase
MAFSRPVTEIIAERFSCRTYLNEPIAEETRQQLADFVAANQIGPFGSPTRFELVAATGADQAALRGLRTYGFIRNPAGFVIGAMGESDKNLEDFGYAMERIILCATDLGLGTCWLGGSFTKSRFARRISATSSESVPAVTSVGYVMDHQHTRNSRIRRRIGAIRRYPWEHMFFEGAFNKPVSQQAAGVYAVPLEMVRLGPSASNKQPWRIVKDGNAWHFYIQRTPGYRDRWVMKLLRIADMQRIDAGIAMSHFELAANELGLMGRWEIRQPRIEKPDEWTEYTVSWVSSEERSG